METKFREDPLTVMKQRESEKRLELLRNTAKVKKLRRLLTMQKHMKEKKLKEKRLKKKRRSRSRSSSSESSSGDELLDKFIKIVRQSDEIDAKHHGEQSDSTESKPRYDKHAEVPRRDGRPTTSHARPPEKPKLTRDELEARRLQMMNDAKEHAKDRSLRTSHHYLQKKEQETKEAEARSRHGASFIRQMKNDHTQRSTIEDSIHRKASSRQRGELSTNFLKR
ncbi:unnamed protein product [Echinostoma caproni]|uniref:Pre-mRNA-splicing factor CWC25 homolog n=1 Tax=Echinostoma caproni TaxID=27848 RepID=A0A183A2M0_9TREM|nr:unnamed protein product [Echinostoma caproni]